MKEIRVTCAVVFRNEDILAVQRSEKMTFPLKWEFPGGKVKPNESDEECIKREVLEELEIQITLKLKLESFYYNYPNFKIELIPFIAEYAGGNLRLTEHREALWLKTYELKGLDWAEADIALVNEILKSNNI